jgi:hypothetical protein
MAAQSPCIFNIIVCRLSCFIDKSQCRPAAKGIRRIARVQIDRTLEKLSQASPACGDTVQQVCKRIRKLHALVRLLELHPGQGICM